MPSKQAKKRRTHSIAIVDTTHPEAGRGGVVPPAATRFAPGISGNPSGRPKGSATSFEKILEQELERLVDGDPRFDVQPKITRRRRLVRVLLDLTELGDTRAARLLLDRAWRPTAEPERIGVVLHFDAQDAEA